MREIKFSILQNPNNFNITNNICSDFDCDCLEMTDEEVYWCIRHPDGLFGICVMQK